MSKKKYFAKIIAKDDEIIARHKLFSKSRFKSKRVIELNNDSNKTEPINSIIKVIVKDLNENN